MTSPEIVVGAPSSYSIADVVQPDFKRSWQEAVAIVQEVASQVAPETPVPDAEDLTLDGDGRLELGFGPDTAGHPVTALASLLQMLLEGLNDAPAGLRALANENSQPEPAHASVEGFYRALAFYERPGRSNDLQAVASRLRSFVRSRDSQVELERLRDKLATAPKAPAAPDRSSVAKSKVGQRVALLVGICAIGAMVVGWALRSGVAVGARSATTQVEQKLADTLAAGLQKLGVTAGTPVSAELTPAESMVTRGGSAEAAKPMARGASKPPAARGRSGVADASEVFQPTANPYAQPSAAPYIFLAPQVIALEGEKGFDSEPRPQPQPPEVAAPGVPESYSSSNGDVEPPRLRRQQLPRQPEPGDDTGYFDITVGENGQVEQVQLVSPINRFEERMLLAAAKAWTFKPAMRNGVPVRYRIFIPIILKDKL